MTDDYAEVRRMVHDRTPISIPTDDTADLIARLHRECITEEQAVVQTSYKVEHPCGDCILCDAAAALAAAEHERQRTLNAITDIQGRLPHPDHRTEFARGRASALADLLHQLKATDTDRG